ncbi:MAG: hypothetical protein KDE19_00835, partial [Caldilineaceae bacterium]|nr:hypothetical protein [Caldilineaceae bacterium]
VTNFLAKIGGLYPSWNNATPRLLRKNKVARSSIQLDTIPHRLLYYTAVAIKIGVSTTARMPILIQSGV